MVRRVVPQRQRIGPQIRLLRQEHGLTLDDLAGQAGLSASHLSRLERSQTLPSFTVLAKIAQVLGVSIDDFVQLEQDLEKLDGKLASQANLLALNEDAYTEILGLSIDTRRQINRAIEALSGGQLCDTPVQEEAFEILTGGDLPSVWPKVRKFIRENGMTGVGLARAVVQLNAIPGARAGVLMSRGLLPATPNIDLLKLYRDLFPTLPIDPSVVRRWGKWGASNNVDALKNTSARIIVHADLFGRLGKGWRKSSGDLGARCAREVAGYWKTLYDADDSFEIAIIEEEPISGNIVLAGGAGAVVEDHSHTSDDIDEHRAGLWISSRHLVEPIARQVDEMWDSLPAGTKNRSRVSEWLEEHSG
jgi:transcriptional regulator with XRE-family HTH domain